MLLLLAIALQDPLGDEDIAVREAAAQDLVRGGDLDTLRARLAAATDSEIRARLKGVVDRLETEVRRRDFGGGKEVGGLRARLTRLEKPIEGRPPFRLEIMNVDAVARPFVPVEVLNESLPESSLSMSSAQGRVVVRRLEPRNVVGRRYICTSACGGGPDRKAVYLRPGESRRFDDLLEERLPAGDYEISVTYFASRLLPGLREDLVTDTQRFEIKD